MARKIQVSVDSEGKHHLSNILSKYTGRPLTYTETSSIASDAECISPIFRKYKGIYYELDGFNTYDPREFKVKANGSAYDAQPFQKCVDAAIKYRKAIDIVGLDMNWEKQININGTVKITGSVRNTIIRSLDLPAGQSALSVADSVIVNGFEFDGARMFGKSGITCIRYNPQNNAGLAVTDSVCSNLRIENFGIGLKGQYSWCNSFINVRWQSCDKPLELGSQFNNTDWYRCSIVSCRQTATATNCEGLNWASPNWANSTAPSIFNLNQSNLSCINPYYENIAGNLVVVGGSNDVIPSSFTSIGGKSTDPLVKIVLGGNRSTIMCKNLSPNSKFVCYDGTANISPYKYSNRIEIDSNQQTAQGFIIEWDSKQEAPFPGAFGGSVNVRTIKSLDYCTVKNDSAGNNGYMIASNLVVGEYYTLAYAIRKTTISGEVVIRHDDLASQILPTNDPGEEFEIRYNTFQAKRTKMSLTWDAGVSIDFWYVGIAEKGAVPTPVRSHKMFAPSIPTEGTFRKGNELGNSSPNSGNFRGWVCAAGGSPGTWRPGGTVGEIAGVDGAKPGAPVPGYVYGNLTTDQGLWWNGTAWIDFGKFIYSFKTGNTNIQGPLNEYCECNTTVALTQTLRPDSTTAKGTIKKFRNNGNFALTIAPDTGVTINGASTSVVCPAKGDYVELIATSANVWRVVTLQVKQTAAALTTTAPVAVSKTISGTAPATYTQAEAQKMADDIGNLTAQLNNMRTYILELVANQRQAGSIL